MAWDAINPLLLQSDGHDSTDSEIPLDIPRKNHVIINIRVSDSGKTHLIFDQNGNNNVGGKGNINIFSENTKKSPLRNGNSSNMGNTGDGIVPRIINDLFLAEEDNNMKRMLMQTPPKRKRGNDIHNNVEDVAFGVQISMVHVHNDCVLDMLSATTGGDQESGKNKDPKGKTKGIVPNVLQMAASIETRNSKNSKSVVNAEQVFMDTLRIS